MSSDFSMMVTDIDTLSTKIFEGKKGSDTKSSVTEGGLTASFAFL